MLPCIQNANASALRGKSQLVNNGDASKNYEKLRRRASFLGD